MPLFQDHFLDNKHGWEQTDTRTARLAIGPQGYAYNIEHLRPVSEWTTWQPLFPDNVSAYKIHTVIERVSGASTGYGVLFRCADEQNCFSFELNSSGAFRLRRRANEQWSVLSDWQTSQHIRPGERAINEITIEDSGDSVRCLVNGSLVHKQMMVKSAEHYGFGYVANRKIHVRVHSVIVMRHVEWDDAADREIAPMAADVNEVLAELDALIGLDNIKQEVRTFVNFLKVQKLRQERGMRAPALSYHMVLAGPPGTGKTTVARLIGKIYKALGLLPDGHLVETDRAGLVAPYVGQTAQRVDEMVEKALGGVLFIDEAYALMPPGDRQGNDFGREAIDTLLKRMEDQRGKFAVVIAGYATELERFLDANPGVRSRFNRYFYFEHYKPYQLRDIFKLLAAQVEFELSAETDKALLVHMAAVCKQRTGSFGNGRYARNLLEKSLEQHANRVVNIEPITDELLSTLDAADIPRLPLTNA